MKRSLTIFLQAVIVVIGIGALLLLLWEPHLEGRNAQATFFEVYFNDPFLAYVYAASVAFFIALYQAFRLLGYIGRNNIFSQVAVNALRSIKYCVIILSVLIVGAAVYLRIFHAAGDDPAGAIALCIVATLISIVIGTAAAVFEKTLQSAVDIKSENDLTV